MSVLSGPVALAMAAGLLGAFGLSACGGSSGSSTTHANAAAAASSSHKAGTTTPGSSSGATTSGGAPGAATPGTPGRGTPGKGNAGAAAGAQLAAVRECLQRNGVKLPAQPAGGLGAFRNLPAGVSRAKMQATVRKCLGGGRLLHTGRAGALRLKNPTFHKALESFASCLRQNGVNVPQPNTSGRGPVFSTKGINTASPQFRKATQKCRGALSAAFGVKR